MAQVLFFNVFSEKDPHLGAVEQSQEYCNQYVDQTSDCKEFIKISLLNFWKSLQTISFGEIFQKRTFTTDMIILQKPDNPVSMTHMLRKKWGLFVIIKSMQLGFSGFLKHVHCLMRRFRQYELQNVFIVLSSTYILKSPINLTISSKRLF